jgi:hypothetical protein
MYSFHKIRAIYICYTIVHRCLQKASFGHLVPNVSVFVLCGSPINKPCCNDSHNPTVTSLMIEHIFRWIQFFARHGECADQQFDLVLRPVHLQQF